MNSYLEKIKDIILSSDRFSVEEKEALLSAVTDADKQWTITDFKLDRTEKVKQTTAILLEQTIGELEEKRKAIEETNIALHKSFEVQEEKNHELSIEASLERVRTKAMAMQKPDDMLGVCRLISDELHKLNVNNIRYVQTVIFNQPDHEFVSYQYFEPYGTDAIETIAYEANEAVKEFALSMLASNDAFYTKTFGEPDIQALIRHRKENHQLPDPLLDKAFSLHFYFYSIESGALGMSTYAPVEEEILHVLKRFRNVFELAYRRYRDIAKAEEQAKEAQLELSLERVRARAMAMHQSDELAELVSIFFQELRRLEFPVTSCIIWINNPETSTEELWVANTEISKPSQAYFINPFHHSFFKSIIHAWKERDRKWIYELSGKEKEDFQAAFFKDVSILPDVLKKTLQEPEKVVFSASFSSFGALEIVGNERISDEKFDILHRFGKVFDLSFTRFIDLKKAEALAREGRIELGLERVRTRAMAMQRSEDLKEMIGTVFVELTKLDLELTRCIIMIFDPKTNGSKWWMANSEAPSEPMGFFVKNHDYPPHQAYVKAWKEKLLRFEYVLEGNNKRNWDDFLFVETELSQLPDFVISGMKAPTRVLLSGSFNNFGCLNVASLEPLSEEHFDILLRFAKVFDLTYTRFNDLKQAEAQVRESQIELALERVRARTMAMFKSDELADAAAVLFQQLHELGDTPERINIGIVNEEAGIIEWWLTEQDGKMIDRRFTMAIDEPIFMSKMYDGWKKKKKSMVIEVVGQELNRWLEYIKDVVGIPFRQEFLHQRRVNSVAFFSQGLIAFTTAEQQSPGTILLLQRFAKVFDLTYTRFLDLKKAENQAREARIETALEKLRSRTMAMQKSDELTDVAKLLFKEVKELGIEAWTTGFNVWSEDNNSYTDYLTDPQGEFMEPYIVYADQTALMREVIDARKSGMEFFVQYAEGEKLKEGYLALLKFGDQDQFEKILKDGFDFPSHQYDHFVFGSKLSLMFITYDPVPEAHDLFKRFGKVFEQTYTRFLDLKKAEMQARDAQIEVALERTRTSSMLMQHSDEIKNISGVFHEQLLGLGIPSEFSFVWLPDEPKGQHQFWATWVENENGTLNLKSKSVTYPLDKSERYTAECFRAWESGKPVHIYNVPPNEVASYFAIWDELIHGAEKLKAEFFPDGLYYAEAFMQYGCFGYIISRTLIGDEQEILRRFSVEFERAYTRFIDLQRSEAQARESQIQLAMERVRARTMAMQKSDELSEAASLLFKQIADLGTTTWSSGFDIWEEDRNAAMAWMANPDGSMGSPFLVPYTEDPFFKRIHHAGLAGNDFFVMESGGKELEETYQYLFNLGSAKKHFDGIRDLGFKMPAYQITHCAFFSQGYLMFITYEPVPEMWEIFKRFAKVFEQTYTRFLDLQKAEAQAREAQIEAALERVRSRTMGMQKSDELKEVIQIVYEQFIHLNINIDHTGFVLDYKARDDYHIWIADKLQVPSEVTIPYFDCLYYNRFNEAKEKGEDFFAVNLGFEEKNRFYQKLLEIIPDVPEESKKFLFSCTGLAASTVLLDNVCLYIENFSGISYSDGENATLMRFGKVFQQTYTRFLDLQKAEAQAREAQIEAALERVRSRAMAMQKTEELLDAAELVGRELSALGINSMNVSYAFVDESEKTASYYSVNPLDGKILPFAFAFPHTETEVMLSILSSWKKQEPFNVLELDEASTLKHQTWAGNYIKDIFELKGLPFSMEEFLKISPKKAVIYTFNFANGYLFNIGSVRLTAAQEDVVSRITKVFDLTYRRFLDLKQAESQAREAKIEAALERVRSRTMAMQKSSELTDVAGLLFKQVKEMGIKTWTTGFNVWNEDNNSYVDYITSPTGEYIEPYTVDTTSAEALMELSEARKSGKEFVVLYIDGEKIVELYRALMAAAHLQFEKMLEDGIRFPSEQYEHFVFGGKVSLMFITYDPVPEAHDIFRRFGKVFEQTYTRFLDLKTAEAQTRESQIQLAMERVRARTMAMQHSNELPDAANLLFQQVQSLGMPTWSAGYCLWEDNKNAATFYMSSEGEIQVPFSLPLTEESALIHMREGSESESSFYVDELSGDYCSSHYAYMRTLPGISEILDAIINSGFPLPTFQINHMAYFPQGFLLFITYEPVPEAHEIFKRFAKVFEQTYTRFLDLERAEAQALEAIKRASVDRVRAEIASMRTTNDLEKITPLIWNELTTLGVPFIRCGVFIMDEEEQQVNTYLSNPEGKAIAAFHQPFNSPGDIAEVVKSWQKKEMYIRHWDEAMFVEVTKNLVQQGGITSGEKYLTENHPTDLYLHFLPFLQGMLYAGNSEPLSDDALQLVQNLADAFSTAYARYEDFNKLEAAKEQVDKALTDLKQTQTQLVQAEKMASLGELTAGIAHEIQNPLNFVNNFSEVNAELSDEIMQAAINGNIEEIKLLAADIKSNQEKIREHGKRADSIVKGMLQHSRTSSGEKIPTDINVLADEYLRLAYHGFRAKDKSFNASLTTDFDASIGKINIIPQEIGRVLLNLINNAFYAVAEKIKATDNGYAPIVTVSSKKMNDKVEIRVADNGNGIPEKVMDKIFQPFFTTKPTGQGTGLGLSLSYDIVKAHNGELSVTSEEGKGASFTINLPVNDMK